MKGTDVSVSAQDAYVLATRANTRIDAHEEFCEEHRRNTKDVHILIFNKIGALDDKFDKKMFWLLTAQITILITALGALLTEFLRVLR